MRFKSLFPVVLVALGCAGGAGQGRPSQDALSQASVQMAELEPARVAPEIHALLASSELSAQRLNRLASVVRAQLERARFHFDRGNAEEGMAATMGALYLVRSPEYRTELFQGSERPLLQAASHVARLGDEGAALAFYQISDAILPASVQKQEVGEHLAALAAWQAASNEAGSMQAAGARHAAAQQLALVSCSRENLERATASTVAWLERAIVEGRRENPPTTFFEHDERVEARRAVMTSALGLAALYVRDANAAGALSALEREPIASASSDQLLSRLEAAQEGSADAWADLFGLFQSAGDKESGMLQPELARGAAFGAAVSLYRLEPTELRAAIPLSTLLVEHGMADVAPLILSDVVDQRSDERDLVWTLRLVFGALNRAEQMGDLEMARRVFKNAEPLLSLARARPNGASLSPSVGDFYYVLGAMETRAGDLVKGKPYLEQAVSLTPSRDAFRLLSAIDRQRGDLAGALEAVRGIQTLTRKEGDVVGEARAALLGYELEREAGRSAQAATLLEQALERALAARNAARTGTDIAIAETLLAEVLEQYGVLDAAERATERAYDSSQHDVTRLTHALLDAARRALTRGDVRTGREALRRAMESKLAHDDVVYIALWTMLAQLERKVPSDGYVEEVLAELDPASDWTSTLRDWGKKSIDDATLLSRARDVVQRTEAQFYVAAAAYARGTAAKATALGEVAQSPAIELIEVRIARDLLTREAGLPSPSLPPGAEVP